MAPKLTDQQERLCQLYVGEANLVKSAAARLAGYSKHNTTDLFKREGVPERIDVLLKEQNLVSSITTHTILGGILAEAKNQDNNGATRIRAWELLGKHKRMWTEEAKNTSVAQINIQFVGVDCGKSKSHIQSLPQAEGSVRDPG